MKPCKPSGWRGSKSIRRAMNNSRNTRRAMAAGEAKWSNALPPYCQDEPEIDDEHEPTQSDDEGAFYEWLDGFGHYEGR